MTINLIESVNSSKSHTFPKYTSQLINWANQNAQGTRPKVVGQMSELFPKFQQETESDKVSIEGWKEFYIKTHPDSIETATKKIYAQIENLREALPLIDEEMVRSWVEDLIYNKTYNGLYVQKAILSKLAQIQGKDFRLATPEEEAKGIDGFVGDIAYSIKPESYKTMNRLPETIEVKMIYYTKTRTGLNITVED